MQACPYIFSKIYLTKKKKKKKKGKKFDGFYFAVVSWVCRNRIYDICQHIVVEYVHSVRLFSTGLNL